MYRPLQALRGGDHSGVCVCGTSGGSGDGDTQPADHHERLFQQGQGENKRGCRRTGDVLGGNIYETGILEILERYGGKPPGLPA